MIAVDDDAQILPSVLDRLLEDTSENPAGLFKSRGQQLRDLRTVVGRDLQNLLNTRQRCTSWPKDLDQLDTSLISYGIPDFTSANLATENQREQFRQQVEALIRRFEPRFQRVSVTLTENSEPLDRTLRFRIEALIHAEPVYFDGKLEPLSRSFDITTQ